MAGALAILSSAAVVVHGQASGDVVASVRRALEWGGLAAAEKALADSRAAQIAPAERAEALWLLAGALVDEGARSDAVHLLQSELDAEADERAATVLRGSIKEISLVGRQAPAFRAGLSIGARMPESQTGSAQPTLVFFWAHWCQECKAESPIVARLVEKYRSRGLSIVAPTRTYGYVEAGRAASPERELRHIAQVRDTYYPFLKRQPVPVTDANHKAFGIASIPVNILLDRHGIVRLYHPGKIGESELDAAIQDVLER